jgi:hypothetical protein
MEEELAPDAAARRKGSAVAFLAAAGFAFTSSASYPYAPNHRPTGCNFST